MVELELLGLHGDGEHLTLTDQEGRRYRLAIDDALRAAVRRDRPRLEAEQQGDTVLRPKEIQAYLRAGASVAEVAERSGLPEDHVRRYHGPVVAERDWVVQQAQNQRVGRESDAPRLGDLVLDRLAARGVDVETLEWTAVRRAGKPWEVVATFLAGDREREARWSVDLANRTLHAVDDEGRWLSETELGAPPQPAKRHLNAVVGDRSGPTGPTGPTGTAGTAPSSTSPASPSARSTRSAATPAGSAQEAPSAGSAPAASAGATHRDDGTETLLAELAASRGTRVELQPELEAEDGDALWPPAAHPPASRPEEARDAHVLSLPRRRSGSEDGPGTTPALPAEEAEASPPPQDEQPAEQSQSPQQNTRRSRRRNRRSVPSWDEIVFGARPE